MAITATEAQKLYLAYFGRPADPDGLAYYTTVASVTLASAQNLFATSDEYKALYTGLGSTALVNQLYNNILGRDGETAGLAYWSTELVKGTQMVSSIASAILGGAQGADLTTVNNRLAYATAFTAALDQPIEILSYRGNSAAARTVMKPITTDASLATALANLNATVATSFSSGILGIINDSFLSTLTVNQDVLNLSASTDFIRGGSTDIIRGVVAGGQDQTTLNSSDIIDGGAGNDYLVVNLTGPAYTGGARIKNVETLVIGTDLPQATFDYNVNAGSNEITDVAKILADQINFGATLTINNVLKTPQGVGTLPTLRWANDSVNQAAGVVNENFRAAEIAPATDTLRVELSNITNGQLNIADGVETLTVCSNGAVGITNTLNTSLTSGSGADIGTGSTTKIILTNLSGFGATDNDLGIGPSASAGTGYWNRTAGGQDDLGGGLTNLLSYNSTVTEVDATGMVADTNTRFTTANGNTTGVDVKFTGGTGNDYVEFQLGNINAAGYAGDDTFAFINGAANSTFGQSDTIDGGAGSDTIQIGLNGVGSYNVSETELRNKTSIGTLDLRGAVNNLTLSSQFVAAADTPNSIAITTDNINANSPTVAPAGLEATSVNTIRLTELNGSQSVKFTGGQGSDRVILNDQNFNTLQTLNGGATDLFGITAGQGRYDTITVTTDGGKVVIDHNDLANISNFEGLVLTKNAAVATYSIELTRAFLNANTLVSDVIGGLEATGINDTVFQIGTSAAANNAALGLGDTVVIDLRDILNATDTGIAAGFTRKLDVTTLVNAIGVANVKFIGNKTGGAPTLTVADAGVASLLLADAKGENDVVVLSAANPEVVKLVGVNALAINDTGHIAVN